MKRASLFIFLWVFLFCGVFSASSFELVSLDHAVVPGFQAPARRGLLSDAENVIEATDTRIFAEYDGTISLRELDTLREIWSFSSGGEIYSSYQAPHLKNGNLSALDSDYFIDVGEDWRLYANYSIRPSQKLTTSMEEYVNSTPHVLEGGVVVIGSKSTSFFRVDGITGRVTEKHEMPDSSDQAHKFPLSATVEKQPQSESELTHPIIITRKDYRLKSIGPNYNVLWSVSVAEFRAAFLCQGTEESLVVTLLDSKSFEYVLTYKLPLPCQSAANVYRARTPNLFESLIGRKALLEASQRDFMLAPDALPSQSDADSKSLESVPTYNTPLSSQSAANAHCVSNPIIFKSLRGPKSLPDASQRDLMLTAVALQSHANAGKFSECTGNISISQNEQNSSKLVVLLDLSTRNGSSDVLFPQDTRSFLICGVLGLCFLVFIAPIMFFHWGKLSTRSTGTNNSKKKRLRKPGKGGNKTGKQDKEESEINLTYRECENNFWANLDQPICYGSAGQRIGKLFVSSEEIAKGSNGTIVLEGIYQGRPVAVKRLVRAHNDIAFKEIQNLIASDQHPNIISWYGVEEDKDFVYLALERCACSLNDLIIMCMKASGITTLGQKSEAEVSSDCMFGLNCRKGFKQGIELWKSDGYPSRSLLKLMRDVITGIAHLHEIGIVHRDLKPQNVLITNNRSLCAKVSDMGISKRLLGDMSSFSNHATGGGSSGWQAPEQLQKERQTRAVDMFSLGCVLFFCITGGKHPFGDHLERDSNIVKNKLDLFLVENIPEAVDLFLRLLHPAAEMRPKAVEVLCHPLFWNAEMRLSFLRDTSDRVELEDREASSELLQELECIAPIALGAKWDEKMEPSFLNNIGRYRRYKYDSVRDLLRVMRNKLNHYRELPTEIQEVIGPVPDGFDRYFTSRFPKLLIEVYKVMHTHCRTEEWFAKYFHGIKE